MLWQENDLLYHPGGDVDNETLQTDIQRFMAIIGFCLMAVFALVQALPVTGPNNNTVIEDIDQKIDLQEAELEHLTVENGRLKKEVNRLMQYKGIAKSYQKELERAGEALDQQREMIREFAGEKITRRNDLLYYKKLLSERDDEIRELGETKLRVEKILEKAVEKIKDFAQKEKTPDLVDRKQIKNKGLYVAFSSDRVFLNLLGKKKIGLFIYITGMKKGFQVIRNGSQIKFVAAIPSNDLDLWEVKSHMVPFEILEAFKQWSTLSSRDKMLIVGLTPEISRQIRGRKGISGRLIIKEGGKVIHSSDGE